MYLSELSSMVGTLRLLVSNKRLFTIPGVRNIHDENRRVVFIDGVRTPFCKSNTSYEGMMSYQLLSAALLGLKAKTKLDPSLVDYVCAGTVIQEVATSNVAREALLVSNFPRNIPAHTVTQACISSCQAVTTGIDMIRSGNADVFIAGGVDFLTDPPIRVSRKSREALLKLNKAKSFIDVLKVLSGVKLRDIGLELPAVTEFSSNETMGKSADRLTSSFEVSRKEQDEYAMRTHQCAHEAQKMGYLNDVVPIMSKKGLVKEDNTIRVATQDELAKLKPVFMKGYGSITAGNSSPLTDGASACLLMSESKAKELGYKPKAYFKDYLYFAQDPIDQLLIGPAYSMPKLLTRNGLTWKDIDVVELHEAFAGQILSVLKAMQSEYFCKELAGMNEVFGTIPMEILNNWGGSVSLGHPFGATGIRLLTMAANRLARVEDPCSKFAVISGCAAGGLSHAMIIQGATHN